MNQSGQSLIQVLVSFAIMGIVLTAMTTMFNNLNRESKATTEKLGVLDLEKVLIASFADGSACMYSLTKPTPLTFASTAPMSDMNPLVIPMPSTPANPAKLYASHNPTAATPLGPVIAQVGQLASPYSTSLVIKSIALELTSISGDTVTGRWRIDFDDSKLVRPIKPATVSVVLKADITNPASAKFTSCQGQGGGGGSGSGESGEWCGAFGGHTGNSGAMEVFNVISKCKGLTPICPPGYNFQHPHWCFQPGNPFPLGKTTTSACPSGYTMRNLSPDPAGGAGEVLLTCMPN